MKRLALPFARMARAKHLHTPMTQWDVDNRLVELMTRARMRLA